MQLSGNYSHEDLARVLQGNFSCREFTKDSKGKPLPDDKQYIRLELFFLAFEIYPHAHKVIVLKITDDGKGTQELKPILKINCTAP